MSRGEIMRNCSLCRPILIMLLVAYFVRSPTLNAQSIRAEERFQDLFVTAGYGTAFGAALGTALLSFQEEPNKKLRYIAVGASIGFIGGSLLGSYIVFSPVFSPSSQTAFQLEKQQLPQASGRRLALQPEINQNSGKLTHIWGQLSISL